MKSKFDQKCNYYIRSNPVSLYDFHKIKNQLLCRPFFCRPNLVNFSLLVYYHQLYFLTVIPPSWLLLAGWTVTSGRPGSLSGGGEEITVITRRGQGRFSGTCNAGVVLTPVLLVE